MGLLGSAQICGQFANFGVHAALLNQLAPADYGRIGLAGVAASTAVFLLDLGYGQHFLRKPTSDPNWMTDWAVSLQHRFGAAALSACGLLIAWFVNAGANDPGWFYLLGASPAFIAGALNAPLAAIAWGRSGVAGAAIAAQGVSTFSATICALLLAPSGPPLAFALGLAFSFGFWTQAFVCLVALRNVRFVLPAADGWRRLGLLRESVGIWSLALVGTLYERSVLFFIQATDQTLTPFLVFVVQILSGLLNVMSQFQKLVLPALAHGSWDDRRANRNAALTAVGLLAGAVALSALAGGVLFARLTQAHGFLDHGPALAVYAASWTPQCLLVGLGSLWFATGREDRLLWLFVLGSGAATLVSLALLSAGDPMPTLIGKAAVSFMVWFATIAMFKVRRTGCALGALLVSAFVPVALRAGLSSGAVAACYAAAAALCLAEAVRILTRGLDDAIS